MKTDVDAFKRELENYSYYKLNLQGTIKLINYNEHLLSNLHGLDPSKVSGGSSLVWVESDAFKRISDELERLNKRKELRLKQIEYIESVLEQLSEETRKACIDIYVEGKTYESISHQYGYSKGGLWYRIKAELNKQL